MEPELEALTRRVDEIQARALADQVLLEYALLALPSPNLRGMLSGMDELGEDVFVRLMNGPHSEAGFQSFALRREYWQKRLREEIASREQPRGG